jgi:hypothetical protein
MKFIISILFCFLAGCSGATVANNYDKSGPIHEETGEGHSYNKIIKVTKSSTQPNERHYIITKRNGELIVEVK